MVLRPGSREFSKIEEVRPVGIPVVVDGVTYYVNLKDGTATKVVTVPVTKVSTKTVTNVKKVYSRIITALRVRYMLGGKLVTELVIPTRIVAVLPQGEVTGEVSTPKGEFLSIRHGGMPVRPLPFPTPKTVKRLISV